MGDITTFKEGKTLYLMANCVDRIQLYEEQLIDYSRKKKDVEEALQHAKIDHIKYKKHLYILWDL